MKSKMFHFFFRICPNFEWLGIITFQGIKYEKSEHKQGKKKGHTREGHQGEHRKSQAKAAKSVMKLLSGQPKPR